MLTWCLLAALVEVASAQGVVGPVAPAPGLDEVGRVELEGISVFGESLSPLDPGSGAVISASLRARLAEGPWGLDSRGGTFAPSAARDMDAMSLFLTVGARRDFGVSPDSERPPQISLASGVAVVTRGSTVTGVALYSALEVQKPLPAVRRWIDDDPVVFARLGGQFAPLERGWEAAPIHVDIGVRSGMLRIPGPGARLPYARLGVDLSAAPLPEQRACMLGFVMDISPLFLFPKVQVEEDAE